jgi:hypothetical protein
VKDRAADEVMSGVQTLHILFSLTEIVCMFVCVWVYVLEQLVTVDGQDVRRKTVEEITKLLKGTPNTPVKLTLLPNH